LVAYVNFCVQTLYNYIDAGIFLTLTNKDLPRGKQKQKYKKVRKAARAPKGESIERRPEEVAGREAFGHWEMDCVEGKKRSRKTLLVLTERKTRFEIIIPMKSKKAKNVVAALDALERKYGKWFRVIFKSITIDNGSEFSDNDGMIRSCLRKYIRTNTYFCHPYSAFERGSNENQNRFIRRWYPKGTDFGKVPVKEIKEMNAWMNDYPRKLHGWRSAAVLFDEEIERLKAAA